VSPAEREREEERDIGDTLLARSLLLLLLLLLLSAQFGGSCPRAQQSRGRRTASPKYFSFNQLEKVSMIVSLTGLILFGLVEMLVWLSVWSKVQTCIWPS